MIVDASDAEEFSELSTKPLRSLPYDSPGQTFVAFEKPDGVPAVGKFSNMLKFVVKEVLFSTLYLTIRAIVSFYCTCALKVAEKPTNMKNF